MFGLLKKKTKHLTIKVSKNATNSRRLAALALNNRLVDGGSISVDFSANTTLPDEYVELLISYLLYFNPSVVYIERCHDKYIIDYITQSLLFGGVEYVGVQN